MPFLPDAPTLIAFTLAGVILALTPGPDMTLFLGKTLTAGRRAGLAALLGALSGIIVHTLLAAFGLSALLAASETGFVALKTVGGLYLLWLGYQALRHGSALTLERDPKAKGTLLESYLLGLGINLLNPKIILFFVTFLPQFVSVDDKDAAAKLTFLGLYFIALAVPICVGLILMADRFTSAVRRSKRVTRVLDWMFAGLMGAFALKMLSASR